MTYHTQWYHYLIVIFFYLITLVITSSVIYNYTLDQWYSIYIRIPISVLFLLIVIMIIVTHTHAMLSNNAIEERIHNTANDPDCIKCNSDRPQRAHHCQVCNVCIKRMDHHCPWIANCVGEHNQKSFLLLLFYSILGTLIAFLSLFKSFIEFVSAKNDITLLSNNIEYMIINNSIANTLKAISIMGFILSGLMAISIFVLLMIQVNELKCGMTAIELKIFPNNESCPFYNNDLKGNFIALFGSNVFLWLFPMNTFNHDRDIHVNNNYIALY